MKGGLAAAALAAMVGGATAINHRHAHELFAHKRGADKTCGCTTIYSMITGEPTLCPPATTHTPTPTPSTTAIPKPSSTLIVKEPVPTPEPFTCETPGNYTIPATTVTLEKETTVCVGTSTHVTKGTHTVGGVTTVVETATTVTCPVAVPTTHEGVVTNTIITTEYVCPEAGTYTIAPITTTVTEDCDIEYPVPTSYKPGTYTAPQVVVTATETNYVTVCPYTSSELPKPKPTTSKALPPPPPPPAPTTEVPKETPETEKPKTEKPTKKPTGKFTGTFGENGSHHAITYTPYEGETGACKTADQVDKDIQKIKGYGMSVIRVYSTDCNTLEHVVPACKKYGINMIIGVFVKETGCSINTPDIQEQVRLINKNADWDITELFVVGNEALMNGYCTAQELATLITSVKSACPGYSGPYTTAETLGTWESDGVTDALCPVVDFTGANIHPYFNSAVVPSSAGTFVKGQLDILKKLCPGKEPVNMECGWPTRGKCVGTACPGKENQKIALESIIKAAGDCTVLFSLTDDLWKDDDALGCEKAFGISGFLDGLSIGIGLDVDISI